MNFILGIIETTVIATAIIVATAIITKPTAQSFNEYFKQKIKSEGVFRNDCSFLKNIESHIASVVTKKDFSDCIVCNLCIVGSSIDESSSMLFVGAFNTWFCIV